MQDLRMEELQQRGHVRVRYANENKEVKGWAHLETVHARDARMQIVHSREAQAAVRPEQPLSPTRFAAINHPAHITGGTGKFAEATGTLNNIGEADLQAGAVFCYPGKFASKIRTNSNTPMRRCERRKKRRPQARRV